jgi:hypothetical protein
VDQAALLTDLENAAASAHQSHPSLPRLNVSVKPGCYSAQQVKEAGAIVTGQAWHPDARKAFLLSEFTPYDTRFHVGLRAGFTPAGDALQKELGDRVVVTYRPQK